MDWAKHIRRVLVRLGEDATVTGATTATVRGMFLRPYEQLTLGLNVPVQSANPRFVAITADLPVTPATVVTTRGTHNVINPPQAEDPGGYTVLELRR